MDTEELLQLARLSDERLDGKNCLKFARLALEMNPESIQGLRFVGKYAPYRIDRLNALQRGLGIAVEVRSRLCPDGEIVESEVLWLRLALADELARGTKGEVREAIAVAESIADDEYNGRRYAVKRIARWYGKLGAWGRGLPWATLLSTMEDTEGHYLAAMYHGRHDKTVALAMLRRGLKANPHVAEVLLKNRRPRRFTGQYYKVGSVDEAKVIANDMWDAWKAGRDRIEDWLPFMIKEATEMAD